MSANTIVAKNAGAANVALETEYNATANTHKPVHFCASSTVFITDSLTRANTNTTYAANTMIGNTTTTLLTFANVARANSTSGQILNARLTKGGVTGGQTIANTFWIRLHLYNSNPSANGDANTHSISFANRTKRIGYIDFNTWNIGSDCVESYATYSISPTGFVSDANNKLYGIMQTMYSHIPANTETYEVSLTILQD